MNKPTVNKNTYDRSYSEAFPGYLQTNINTIIRIGTTGVANFHIAYSDLRHGWIIQTETVNDVAYSHPYKALGEAFARVASML
jgi:hypothetical protein